MLSKEEIEKARSNILRGNDIESSALILEAMIFDNYTEVGGRVNILKVATRQILNFVEENKNKGNLDYIKEKVKANNRVNQLETNNKKLIEKLENKQMKLLKQMQEPNNDRWEKDDEKYYEKIKIQYKTIKEILKLAKGEKE